MDSGSDYRSDYCIEQEQDEMNGQIISIIMISSQNEFDKGFW